jgi:hypothetical protein
MQVKSKGNRVKTLSTALIFTSMPLLKQPSKEIAKAIKGIRQSIKLLPISTPKIPQPFSHHHT